MKPFDQALAKAGHPICHRHWLMDSYTYIAGPDLHEDVCVQSTNTLYLTQVDDLAMKPLAVVEGREVYPGDVLYDSSGSAFTVEFNPGHSYCWNQLSWTPPVKLERRWLWTQRSWQMWSTDDSPPVAGAIKVSRLKVAGQWVDISQGFEVGI